MCSKVLHYDLSCEQVTRRMKRAWRDAVALVIMEEDNVKLATPLEEIMYGLFDEIDGM
jgi:hypothetical protein